MPLACCIRSLLFKETFFYYFETLLQFVTWVEWLAQFLVLVLLIDDVEKANQLKKIAIN